MRIYTNRDAFLVIVAAILCLILWENCHGLKCDRDRIRGSCNFDLDGGLVRPRNATIFHPQPIHEVWDGRCRFPELPNEHLHEAITEKFCSRCDAVSGIEEEFNCHCRVLESKCGISSLKSTISTSEIQDESENSPQYENLLRSNAKRTGSPEISIQAQHIQHLNSQELKWRGEVSDQQNSELTSDSNLHKYSQKERIREDIKAHGEKGKEKKSDSFIEATENEWIVRFKEYKLADVHHQALKEALVNSDEWIWINRKNPASAFPTDFGLLRIISSETEALILKISQLKFVKDVHRQMRFSRALLMEKRKEFEKHKPGQIRGKNVRISKLSQNKGQHKPETDTESDNKSTFNAIKDYAYVEKPPGKLFTKLSFGLDESEYDGVAEEEKDTEVKRNIGRKGRQNEEYIKKRKGQDVYVINNETFAEDIERRRRLLGHKSQITSLFNADVLWSKGFSGRGVKMAVFDTGVRNNHPHFRNIKERTNWTNEDTLNDSLGHGTFVAGVISSQYSECLGFAQDVDIYAFRVFTNAQVSYTSWFLDAFNYAIATKMNILNLSIGGPDYLDLPFVEKVLEISANNIIMISAIGNDGPLYGTLNNPADQSDVIGVGGIDYSDHIASFSSRGMTTWELPHGYGRMKPDIVAYGREVMGSRMSNGCKSLSGTSVASPVVAGIVCLLASVVPESVRWNILNPASMKQALVEGALRLDGPNMFEQGMGRVHLLNSYNILSNYKPRASLLPSSLDFALCPYTWPFCHQPLYAHAMPLIFNATILNGMGVVGWLKHPPSFRPSLNTPSLLDIQFTYSPTLWPWTGYLGLYIRILPEGSFFDGFLEGNISFTVVSPPGEGEEQERESEVNVYLKVKVIPTPQRERRILFDNFHNMRYPPGYVPRDSLDVRDDILDWHGDHIHTNFHGMFNLLRDHGYYVEVLSSPFTCFDASQYGTLLLVDLEEEFYPEEIDKLKIDIEENGLGLAVFAEWYNVETMVKMRFFDDNTRSYWTPVTGGANIPALNSLLLPYGIAFGDTILAGVFAMGGHRVQYASGANIVKFPAMGYVHRFLLQDTTGNAGSLSSLRNSPSQSQVEAPILGLTTFGKGRIGVYGDSNCLDNSHMVSNCYWLLRQILNFTSSAVRHPLLFPPKLQLDVIMGADITALPERRNDINFTDFSSVLSKPLICDVNNRIELLDRASENTPGKFRRRKQSSQGNLSSELNDDEGEQDMVRGKTERKDENEMNEEHNDEKKDANRLDKQKRESAPMILVDESKELETGNEGSVLYVKRDAEKDKVGIETEIKATQSKNVNVNEFRMTDNGLGEAVNIDDDFNNIEEILKYNDVDENSKVVNNAWGSTFLKQFFGKRKSEQSFTSTSVSSSSSVTLTQNASVHKTLHTKFNGGFSGSRHNKLGWNYPNGHLKRVTNEDSSTSHGILHSSLFHWNHEYQSDAKEPEADFIHLQWFVPLGLFFIGVLWKVGQNRKRRRRSKNLNSLIR